MYVVKSSNANKYLFTTTASSRVDVFAITADRYLSRKFVLTRYAFVIQSSCGVSNFFPHFVLLLLEKVFLKKALEKGATTRKNATNRIKQKPPL